MRIRCPHCHHPVEFVDDASLSDVNCPSCGSHFSLIDAGATQSHHTQRQTIGHLELLQRVGIGHFGAVWKARDTTLDRIVAVKIPRQGQLDEAAAELFFREARAAAQLNHPGIVGVHEVGRDEGSAYIVSDFVDGASLKDWLTGQRLTVRESAELIATIAEALAHAHAAGVVHRDLKPGNIMMDREGRPQITDFGLAKREAGEITMTVDGQVLGTPAYMSPEQAQGKGHAADARSDLYSLGVILFELLTGELPFRGEQRMLLVQIVDEAPPSLRQLDIRVPRDLETIALKCLEKDPDRRYDNARALAKDLRRWLVGQPIAARPVSSVERGWRWAKRNQILAGMLAALLLVFATGTLASSWQWLRAEQERRVAQQALINATQERRRADEHARSAKHQAAQAQQQRDAAHRNLYLANMHAAQQAFEASDFGLWVRWLEAAGQTPEGAEVRGPEWYYQWRRCTADLLTLDCRAPEVSDLAFSANGQLLTAASNGALQVWDIDQREQRIQFPRDVDGYTIAAFSHAGQLVVADDTAWSDGRIDVWDSTSGWQKKSLDRFVDECHPTTSFAFSDDSQRLAVARADDVIAMWNIETGEYLHPLVGHGSVIRALAFSLDHQQLATGDREGRVKVWNVDTGEHLETLAGLGGFVGAVVISPDGRRVAAGDSDGTIKLWDLETGDELKSFPYQGTGVASLAFSSDGGLLAAGYGNCALNVWDIESGNRRREFFGHRAAVAKVAFSPDALRLASGDSEGIVKLWDVEADLAPQLLTVDGEVFGFKDNDIDYVAVTSDGRRLALGNAEGVQLIEVESSRELAIWRPTVEFERQSGNVWPETFVPAQRRLTLRFYQEDRALWESSDPKCFAYNSDGNQLAIVRRVDAPIELFDLVSGEQTPRLVGHRGGESVAFSPDGQILATGGLGGRVKLWEVESGVLLKTLSGHDHRVSALAFAVDGQRLVSGSTGVIKIWDVESGVGLATLVAGGGEVHAIGFSSDGRWLAAAADDGEVRLWDGSEPENRYQLGGLGRSGEIALVRPRQ